MLHLKDSHHANQAASTPSLFTVCRLESNTWSPTNPQPSPSPQAKKITSPPIVYECVRVNGCAACDVVSRTLLQHIPH